MTRGCTLGVLGRRDRATSEWSIAMEQFKNEEGGGRRFVRVSVVWWLVGT